MTGWVDHSVFRSLWATLWRQQNVIVGGCVVGTEGRDDVVCP